MAKKILIVEDEPSLAELNKLVLGRSGFDVYTCDNGRDAVAMVHEIKPDLILLDVMLPGMDGSAIAKELSENPATNSIPIIVSTALEEAKSLFKDLPQVKDFLFKPVSPAVLSEKVKALLN